MPMGNTDFTATKNALIIELVQRELIDKAVMMPTFADYSSRAVKGAKSISVPSAGSFAVQDRATATAATLVNVTYAVDTITLDQESTVSWLIDPQDEVESTVSAQADTAQRAARAEAKNFDSLTIAGLETDSTATTTAGVITKAIFLEMRETLLAANADPSQLTFACGPTSETLLLAISDFVDANKYGSSKIPSGVLGTLYGVPVVISNGIAASTFYLYDKDGYGYATQRALNMSSQLDNQYGSTAVRNTMDWKWGHGELQNGALLVKDNN